MSDSGSDHVPRRTFERERAARKEAERLLEEKARELFDASRALELMNAGLEERIAARTRELAEALARAEEASRAKSRFLAVVSHELRTPLTSILGYADLLREPMLEPAERGEFAGVVHRSGERLLAMIDRVLQIAELEQAEDHLRVGPLDLPATLEGELDRVRSAAEDRAVTLHLRGDGPVPRMILAAGDRVRAAVGALLENAVRFTEAGRVELVVAYGRAPDGGRAEDSDGDARAASDPTRPRGGHVTEATGAAAATGPEASATDARAGAPAGEPAVDGPVPPGHLRIEVHDNGVGIAEADLDRIFEPFEQVETGMSRRWDGPGLGLTIARNAARVLGGDVIVRSEPGHGSIFRLQVPVEASARGGWLRLGEGMPLPRRGPRDAAAGRPIEGLRVLVAEDQAEIRWLVRQVLERAGATVLEAADGEELIERVGRETIDLVVTDLQMPRCDGYTAIARLRADGFDRPVLALTAHALGSDVSEARSAGCDEYLVKPVDPVRLVDACLRWQGRRHLPAAPAARRDPEGGDSHRQGDDGTLHRPPPGPDDPGDRGGGGDERPNAG